MHMIQLFHRQKDCLPTYILSQLDLKAITLLTSRGNKINEIITFGYDRKQTFL